MASHGEDFIALRFDDDEEEVQDLDEPKMDGQDQFVSDEQQVGESYTVTTQRCVRHVTRRDYPIAIKRRRINEPETDPEEDLWGRCPYVEESLKKEKFPKRELSEIGLRVVKERLTSQSVKVVDLESRWRKFHKMEAQLELFRADLIRDQAQLVLNALEIEDDDDD